MPKTKILNSAGITAAIGLAALPAIFSLAPMFSVAEANAEPSTIGAAATIVPNLSLSAENVSMIMTPTGSGTVFKTASVDATVSTNNETGYTLYFSDKDDNTSLKHGNLEDKVIASTENILSGNDMLPNTWGYTLSEPATEAPEAYNNATNLGLTYSPIPISYTAIRTRDTLTEGETSKLTFGVKINNGIPSGTYSDEILISAIINYSNPSTDWTDSTGTRITTMQQMTPEVCASVTTPPVDATLNIPEITLRDTRDNKEYQVKKLADGNCWMTGDLKLENYTLTSADSNVTTSVTLPVAKTISQTNTPNTYTEAKIGSNGGNGAYLYNWFAATAATSDVQNITSGNAPQDICPKGWHMPNSSGNASWNKLLRQGQGAYEIATSGNGYSATKVSWGKFSGGIETANTNPLGLQATGNFNGGSLNGATTSGSYWTRTAYSADNAYYLSFRSGAVGPQSNVDKANGRAVRCVADDKEYMQNWSGCSGLAENNSVILKDIRDNKEYTVAKLGDNKCWMTQNLAIADKTLTPADSDVSSNFPLPASTTDGFTESNMGKAVVNISSNTSYGGYYNWYTATAGDNTYPSHAGIATDSICPKGWHLPTHFEFGDITNYKDTFNPIQSGYYHGDALSNRGNVGAYWSSTVRDTTHAYILLHTGGSSMNASYDDGNQNGLSVRCVFGPNPAP